MGLESGFLCHGPVPWAIFSPTNRSASQHLGKGCVVLNAHWAFLMSQVLLLLTNRQKEFAISLAFERSCSPAWYDLPWPVNSPATIYVFVAHLPQEIVLAWFGTQVCNVFKKHFAAYGLDWKILHRQSDKKTIKWKKLPSGQDLKGWMVPSQFSPHV